MEENTDLKAGHPPATKVGNMRVPAARTRNSSSGSGEKITNDELKKQEEEFGTDVAEKKQGQVVSGNVVPDDKAFTPAAVRSFHEKPKPTNEKPHAPVMHNIQQPRK